MLEFVRQHAASVRGVLHGFDRLRFRGTLRRISSVRGLGTLLSYLGILLKDAGLWMEACTKRLKESSLAAAEALDRPVEYISDPSVRKEDFAAQIARRDGIQQGLICVLTAVEPCMTFDIRRNRAAKKLELVSRQRKCLHLYHYFMHPQFGLMHMRLQTWFPFTLWCGINGRSWLARQLDQEKIGYLKRENCFVDVADLERAQELLDRQVKTKFADVLNPIADLVHPLRHEMFVNYPIDYYWGCQDSEWASDIMFKDERTLSEIYPALIRHAMQNVSSVQVMRFLGRKVPAVAGPYGTFAGEIISDLKQRPEGIRIKHGINGNSVKAYNKQGSVLRIETTIVQPGDFKVLRGTQENPKDHQWRPMRKGVADMPRRAQVSQAANDRYAKTLAAAHCSKALKELVEPVCRRTEYHNQAVRALNPLAMQDALLLETVNRGEFTINGFRNRDVRKQLYAQPTRDKQEQKRRGAATTRKIRLLRAHGLIKKVPKTHRYVLTDRGREIITTILAARGANAESLMNAA